MRTHPLTHFIFNWSDKAMLEHVFSFLACPMHSHVLCKNTSLDQFRLQPVWQSRVRACWLLLSLSNAFWHATWEHISWPISASFHLQWGWQSRVRTCLLLFSLSNAISHAMWERIPWPISSSFRLTKQAGSEHVCSFFACPKGSAATQALRMCQFGSWISSKQFVLTSRWELV